MLKNMKSYKFPLLTGTLLLYFQLTTIAQPETGDIYPDWSPGYMDIHHILTGTGECVFTILPDGTTMMIDAGDDNGLISPDNSRSPGEWMTRYILQMMRPLPEKKLDYIFLTHFHNDHMGEVSVSRKKSAKGNYMLTGITEVGDNIPFGKIIDRNWPDYNWPKLMTGNPNMQNYIRFVNWHISNSGSIAERFQVGSNQQFKLLRQPEQYPEFEIRNIVANGQIWTGIGDNVRNHFPPIETLSKEEYPDENQCSSGIRISYGRFDYFNGGDIVHENAFGTWRDIETPVGMVLGPVDVCEANHHGFLNAMGIPFLRAVRPRVFVLQAFGYSHPYGRVLQTMLAQWVYPGDRDIFTTRLLEESKIVIGERHTNKMKSTHGHIVIRVHPGGDNYWIYILDGSSESFEIKSIHGPYKSQ